jgi:cytochrome c-type biogenesis protein CcmF
VTTIGQITLLIAFIAACYSVFACGASGRSAFRRLQRGGLAAALIAVVALTALLVIIARALIVKDYRFDYVAQYSSRSLPWSYSLSALWVGQSGSLLLWSWLLGLMALLYRWRSMKQTGPLRDTTFALLMACLAFLVTAMVFGADPAQPSLAVPQEGAGLSPLLQNPAMLVHPPVVFLGYALGAVPCALAIGALLTGCFQEAARQLRGWTLAAWAVLGAGILLGAQWAYEELGWGGYWGWDPVENASLMPWLTATALIHCGLAWRARGILKKTTLVLAVATFALCNFAAFITRSGVFASLHEFSSSPLGWLFLEWTACPVLALFVLFPVRWKMLSPEHKITRLASREALVILFTAALGCLTAVIFIATAAVPLSGIFFNHPLAVEPAFYNRALIPIGLIIFLSTLLVPAVGWGDASRSPQQRIALFIAHLSPGLWLKSLRRHRRLHATSAIHLGFILLVLGVTGSSLGTRRWETTMERGQSVLWADHSIRFAALQQRRFTDKLVVEAELEIVRQGGASVVLRPAQHLYFVQNQWNTCVAIDSSWSRDFYVILHSGTGENRIDVTFMENPMMRWLWCGGMVMSFGALVALWPNRTQLRTGKSKTGGLSQFSPSRGLSQFSSDENGTVPLSSAEVE